MTLKNRTDQIQNLRDLISDRETELTVLKTQLSALEAQQESEDKDHDSKNPWCWPLAAEEYTRYGRQMILPALGLPGQLRLRNARVLLIGLGGLGCPAAAYLAGAGIGTLGLVDGDVVEVSNLHRQILHSSTRLGFKKVDSAKMALRSINPHLNYIAYPSHLDPITALELFPSYDLILDCTDTPQTRYLISDAAVLSGRPLISASALRTDGQLLVLNHPPTPPSAHRTVDITSGPCYRCVFPRPPPPESVTSCGEGGILGPVVGVMGVMMALEAVKLISLGCVSTIDSAKTSYTPPAVPEPTRSSSMLILSAAGPERSSFRTVRLKGKRLDCVACGNNASITAENVAKGGPDYSLFCGIVNPVSILKDDERIHAKTLSNVLKSLTAADIGGISDSPVLLDVRDRTQFSICSLPGSVNIPWDILARHKATKGQSQDPDQLLEFETHLQRFPSSNVYIICRLGNDSQLAVKKLQELEIGGPRQQFVDVIGGFKSWRRDVDKDWPDY